MKKKRTRSKAAAIIVRCFGYIFALGLSVFFALYMSASTGWTFFYILAAALIFSLIVELLTFITYKKGKIKIEMSFGSTLVYKNEELKLHIKVTNDSRLPVSNIGIKLAAVDGAEYGSDEFSAAVAPKSSTSFDVAIKPIIWGALSIGEAQAFVSDFMHITSFMLKPIQSGDKVYVFPDIPEISPDCPFIRSAADAIRFSDESEDTKENDSFTMFGGMPGFTHREYNEGDPIKRINWKLSSKKDSYYVRLDDEIEAMQQTIVIDRIGTERRLCERSVEGTLGVCSALLKLGFESEVWFMTENGFEPHNVTDEADLAELRTALAYYEFSSHDVTPNTSTQRIPAKELCEAEKTGSVMLFTPCADALLAAEAEAAEAFGINITAISSAAFSESALSGLKIISDDFINS
ncbi:MAG: DUF58 domain-containing protein [Oscillospiraceae bacterium]